LEKAKTAPLLPKKPEVHAHVLTLRALLPPALDDAELALLRSPANANRSGYTAATSLGQCLHALVGVTRPLNSTHRSKRIRKAQQQLSVPCTVRNHCTTKLSVSSELE
jgi:hypothetical protein